jgi:DNA-binding transcriptional LysR family regulator
MNDRLTALKLFVRVAQTRSFSAAGRELGFSQPSASRLIAALEQNVGAALFTRTTRAVTLTEAGVSYLERVTPILAALEEADHEARGTGELRGTLRVGVSSSLAIREVIPNLPQFMSRHPQLRLELLMDDHRQDLVHDGVDVAIRFGALPDSTAFARRLISWPRVLVAAPSYLQRRGHPTSPADLATHSVIVGPGVAPTSWSFRKNRRVMSVAVDGRLMVTVNEGAIAAAAVGLGIMSTVSAGCAIELAKGALVRILTDWDMGVVELHAVLPSGKAAKPSAKAFADFLVDTLHA